MHCQCPVNKKINTKSSTEAELVGVDNAMTFVMWMKHFFESQVKQMNEYSKVKPLGSDTIIEQARQYKCYTIGTKWMEVK